MSPGYEILLVDVNAQDAEHALSALWKYNIAKMFSMFKSLVQIFLMT
jgi:hypothetical protein